MQGLVSTCLEMRAVELTEVYSPAGWLQTWRRAGFWSKSRRDKCSIDLRSVRQRDLIASPPCPLFLNVLNRNDGSSIPLESVEGKVITTRSHFILAVRECVEQMHRGDHFLFEHSSNAPSWNEQRIEKLFLSQVFLQLKDPCVVGICLSGESVFMREPTSWLTNHPDFANALEKWHASVSAVEPDKHVQVKNGLTSARYPVELVESFPNVIREDLRCNEELSDCGNILSWTAGTRRLLGRGRLCRRREWRMCLKQRGSSKHDKTKSSDVVPWALRSPSFVRTWTQKEPRQCFCVGSTPTRVTRVDQTTGLDRS